MNSKYYKFVKLFVELFKYGFKFKTRFLYYFVLRKFILYPRFNTIRKLGLRISRVIRTCWKFDRSLRSKRNYTYHSFFGQTSNHHDDPTVLFPNHLPEFGQRRLHGCLTSDVKFIGALVTLQKRRPIITGPVRLFVSNLVYVL